MVTCDRLSQPLDRIGPYRRARCVGARHCWPPFRIVPTFTRKDVPHLSESRSLESRNADLSRVQGQENLILWSAPPSHERFRFRARFPAVPVSNRRRRQLAGLDPFKRIAVPRRGIQVNGHLSWRISSRNFGSQPAHFRRVLTLPLALLARTRPRPKRLTTAMFLAPWPVR